MSEIQKTNNIYKSWFETAATNKRYTGHGEVGILKELNHFSIEELQHLHWILEEEIKTRLDKC